MDDFDFTGNLASHVARLVRERRETFELRALARPWRRPSPTNGERCSGTTIAGQPCGARANSTGLCPTHAKRVGR
jgi:hypothetical protein